MPIMGPSMLLTAPAVDCNNQAGSFQTNGSGLIEGAMPITRSMILQVIGSRSVPLTGAVGTTGTVTALFLHLTASLTGRGLTSGTATAPSPPPGATPLVPVAVSATAFILRSSTCCDWSRQNVQGSGHGKCRGLYNPRVRHTGPGGSERAVPRRGLLAIGLRCRRVACTGRCVGTKLPSCEVAIPHGATPRSRPRSAESSCMAEPDLLELFVGWLAEIGANHLVTGSVAATLYGEPRTTHDIDLDVELTAAAREALLASPTSRYQP